MYTRVEHLHPVPRRCLSAVSCLLPFSCYLCSSGSSVVMRASPSLRPDIYAIHGCIPIATKDTCVW